jgi:hypothetical protein
MVQVIRPADGVSNPPLAPVTNRLNGRANPFTARFETGLPEEPLSEEPLPQEPLLEEPEPEKPVPLLDVPLPEVHRWKSHYRMNRWNCHYLIRWSRCHRPTIRYAVSHS